MIRDAGDEGNNLINLLGAPAEIFYHPGGPVHLQADFFHLGHCFPHRSVTTYSMPGYLLN